MSDLVITISKKPSAFSLPTKEEKLPLWFVKSSISSFPYIYIWKYIYMYIYI